MLTLMGRGYVIDHCVSALIQLQEDDIFKRYVATALKLISINTTGGEERYAMRHDYSELIDRTPADTRTAEEVIDHVLGKIKEVRDDPASIRREDNS